MAAYGYIRQVGDGRTTLEWQAAKIRSVARAAGLKDIEIVKELPGSGSVPFAVRPRGAELLARLSSGDTLVVAKLDQAFHSAADALAMAETLKARNIDLVIADLGSKSVTRNGRSRMFLGMLALVSEFERLRSYELAQGERGTKRQKGGHVGGHRPFGFQFVGEGTDKHLEPVPEEQAAIAIMKEMHRRGESLRAIAAAMTARGHAISHTAVKRVLNS